MGDAGFEADNSIKAAGYDLKSDILKVGYHGSSSAYGMSFLAKVKPANLVTFSSSADARAQGYVPCERCNPP
jgi:beta-lactamase superfamily II metal-dependent hydrolase